MNNSKGVFMEKISLIIQQIVEVLIDFGPVGGFFLVIIESILPVLPLGVIVGLNMLSFGKVFGFLLSYVATICGCIGSFFLFRYVIKDKFMNLFSEKNRVNIDKWMKRLTEINFSTLVVILALPVTPAFAVNIAAGLCDIKFRKYFMALLIGKPAMLLFYGYIAVSVVESLHDPMNFIKVGVLVLIAYVISKILQKIVKVEK